MRGAAADHDEVVTQTFRLHDVHQRGEVVHVQVLLRDRLRYEDDVGPHAYRFGDQRFVGDLASEVAHLESAVGLQPRVAVISLVIEDRIDADAVGIGADARADDANRAAPLGGKTLYGALGADPIVDFVVADRSRVDRVLHLAVDDVVRGLRGETDVMDDFRLAQAHLPGDRFRGRFPGR